MTLFVDQAGSLRRQRASEAAGVAAVAIAAAAFIGWWAGLPLLASWGAGLPAMKPVAAACVGALGLALIYPGRLAALDPFGIDFGINRWLVPRAAVPGTNAMAVSLGLRAPHLRSVALKGITSPRPHSAD